MRGNILRSIFVIGLLYTSVVGASSISVNEEEDGQPSVLSPPVVDATSMANELILTNAALPTSHEDDVSISIDLRPEEKEILRQRYYNKKIKINILKRKICFFLSAFCNYGGYILQSVGSFMPILEGFQGVASENYTFAGTIISFVGGFLKPGETHFQLLAKNAYQEMMMAKKELGIGEAAPQPSSYSAVQLRFIKQKPPVSSASSCVSSEKSIEEILHKDNLDLYERAVFLEDMHFILGALCNYISYISLGVSGLLPGLRGYDFMQDTYLLITSAVLFFVGVTIKPGQPTFEHLSKINGQAAKKALEKAQMPYSPVQPSNFIQREEDH